MSDVITSRCDECGRLKAEANHWLKALKGPGWFYLIRCEGYFATDHPKETQVLDLCSESCAVKAMSKAIGEQQQ